MQNKLLEEYKKGTCMFDKSADRKVLSHIWVKLNHDNNKSCKRLSTSLEDFSELIQDVPKNTPMKAIAYLINQMRSVWFTLFITKLSLVSLVFLFKPSIHKNCNN